MPSCKEVTGRIASDELTGAGWWPRLRVRLHLFMCRHCRCYADQVRSLGTYARERWGAQATDPAVLERLERAIFQDSSKPPDHS